VVLVLVGTTCLVARVKYESYRKEFRRRQKEAKERVSERQFRKRSPVLRNNVWRVKENEGEEETPQMLSYAKYYCSFQWRHLRRSRKRRKNVPLGLSSYADSQQRIGSRGCATVMPRSTGGFLPPIQEVDDDSSDDNRN
jgi:hypothetical protein